MPELSVLIPTYNGARFLGECLARIPEAAEGLEVEVLVADNGSSDATVAQAQRLPGVHVLELGRNTGFSAAVNEAAGQAEGQVLVLLNQDVYLEPGSLKAMHRFLSGRRAVAGGALRDPDGSEQASCGPFPTLANTLWRLLLPTRSRKYYVRPRRAAQGAVQVEWATGAFLGTTREVFELLGGLDEDFFMYYEDVDLCLRAAKANIPTYFLPGAAGVHNSPYASRRKVPDWLRREVRKSQATFFKKHRPASERTAIAALNRAYFAWNGWTWEAAAAAGWPQSPQVPYGPGPEGA